MTARGEEGFTLIEMIVSLAILAIALGVLFGAFSQEFERQRLSAKQMQARTLAQSLLDESRGGAQPGTRDGVSPEGFSWRVTASPYGDAVARKAWRFAAALVTADVRFDLDGAEHHVTLTTLRAEAPP
jgi:prepilin-type N-terminal cleavage/methylation domain-containing protein